MDRTSAQRIAHGDQDLVQRPFTAARIPRRSWRKDAACSVQSVRAMRHLQSFAWISVALTTIVAAHADEPTPPDPQEDQGTQGQVPASPTYDQLRDAESEI